MLEQHPVPQNVTNFQFKLVGDMTLKQFGYLAGGAILAYISYNLPLPVFFTWPLTALFALAGIGFAFIPIEERSMDVWFISFIKSVYSPTLYVWQRDTPYSSEEAQSNPFGNLSVFEKFFLSKKLIGVLQGNKKVVMSNPTQGKQNSQTSTPMGNSIFQTSLNSTKNMLHNTQGKIIPQKNEEQPIKITEQINKTNEDKKMSEEKFQSIKKSISEQNKSQPIIKNEKNPQISSSQYPPNIICGIVKQKTGETIHNILVTVKDKNDIPLRALKTNKTGEFLSPTPLPNGVYTIDVEDPKGIFFFQKTHVTLEGRVLEPIVVLAKSKQDLERQKLEEALFGKKS